MPNADHPGRVRENAARVHYRTIAAGATVITDGWSGYLGINALGYHHDRRSQRAARARGEDIDGLLPGVHRIASLAKRWLLSTHQGAVEVDHLPGYLDEFCFRRDGLSRRPDVGETGSTPEVVPP